ncbi:hypothetical protein NQ117_19450 [Paenibacillus sp. SC116]|nr:hypothetical protein [Paenibacillus sp. SC116]
MLSLEAPVNTGIGRTFQLADVGFRNYQTFQIDFTSAAINNRSSVNLEFRVNGAGNRPSFLFLDTVVIVPRSS